MFLLLLDRFISDAVTGITIVIILFFFPSQKPSLRWWFDLKGEWETSRQGLCACLCPGRAGMGQGAVLSPLGAAVWSRVASRCHFIPERLF